MTQDIEKWTIQVN